ncbi:MAG TPA: ATP-binding protein [Acidimicrobiia bacterium]|nr:ATP-binding protein [Acidimicrobiia bacterium]
MDHDVSQLTVEARPTAGAAVRRAVVDWMDGHPRLDDVLLAITELVNNAVIHGGLEPDDGLTVTVGPDGGLTRFTVGHAGVLFAVDDLPPSSREPGASRGLAIVDKIADVWGVDSDGVEVTAWFEVGPG